MGGVLELNDDKKNKKEERMARLIAEEERRRSQSRRGMESNINTSHSGILNLKEDTLQRKKLLGE